METVASCELINSVRSETEACEGKEWSKFRKLENETKKSTQTQEFHCLNWLVLRTLLLEEICGANEVGFVIKHNTCTSHFERHRYEIMGWGALISDQIWKPCFSFRNIPNACNFGARIIKQSPLSLII